MKKVYLHNLAVGDVLARPAYLASGKVLFDAGVEVTEEVKDTLARYGVIELYIEGGEDPLQQEMKSDEVAKDAILPLLESYRNKTREMVEKLIVGDEVSKEEVEGVVEGIIEAVAFNKNVALMLSQFEGAKGTYLIPHSINTTMFAVAVAKRMGYSEEDIERIGMSAMLHDVGMASILPHIDGKEELGEEEWDAIKRHTKDGVMIAKEKFNIDDELILSGIQKHHERKDGSGYPDGLSGEEIEQTGYIVMICDVYSALTTERIYRRIGSDPSIVSILRVLDVDGSERRSYLPYEAMRIIMADADRYYDVDVVKHLLYTVAIYPLGSLVMLNTGEVGRVAGTTDNPFRPKVDILVDGKGVKLKEPYRLDLSEKSNFKIYVVKGVTEEEYGLYYL